MALLRRQRVLLSFGVAATGMNVAGMICGLIIISWLPPEQLGVWKALLIVQPYLGLLSAGVKGGLNRELPFRIGAGDTTQVRRLASTTQTYTLVCCGLLLGASGASIFVSEDPMVRFALPAVFAAAAGGQYLEYLTVTYRADQEFRTLSKVYWTVAGLNIVTLMLVHAFGYYGLPLRVIAIAISQCFLLHTLRPIRVPLAFRVDDFILLMKVGLPIFFFGYLIAVSATFPNTVLLLREGAEAVGKFAPALALFGMMTLIPKAIAQYVYARMSFQLGQTGDLDGLWRQAWRSSITILGISTPMVVGAVLIFPSFVREFYPEYVASIGSVGWIALAGAFFGSQMFSSALNSMKAWKWIFTYTAVRVILAFCIPFLAYRVLVTDPLAAVASGYAVAGGISFVVGLACTFRATHPSKVTQMDGIMP